MISKEIKIFTDQERRLSAFVKFKLFNSNLKINAQKLLFPII